MPKPLRRALPGHDVRTTVQMGWQNLKNGKLLAAAAPHFDVVLSVLPTLGKGQLLVVDQAGNVVRVNVPRSCPAACGGLH